MSLPYRGHGPSLIDQVFKISSFAGDTLLGLTKYKYTALEYHALEQCIMNHYLAVPTDGGSIAHRLVGSSDAAASPFYCSGQRTSSTTSKTNFMSLPVEIRAMILRYLLGGRKVHAHYERRVADDPYNRMSEGARTKYIPQYSFCCHKHYRSIERKTGSTIKRKCYEDRHIYCYKQPGGEQPAEEADLKTLELYQDCEYINGSRWSKLFTDRLSMLIVSKTVREEALEALYSTNTFSFGDHASFGFFIRRVTPRRAALMRRIELSTKIEYDAEIASQMRVYHATDLPYNWIFTSSDSDDLLGLQTLAKLANVTDLIIRLHDKVPVIHNNPETWKKIKNARLSQLKWALHFAYVDYALLRKIKRVKVRIVCVASCWEQELRLKAHENYQLDKDSLRAVEEKFASDLVVRRAI